MDITAVAVLTPESRSLALNALKWAFVQCSGYWAESKASILQVIPFFYIKKKHAVI